MGDYDRFEDIIDGAGGVLDGEGKTRIDALPELFATADGVVASGLCNGCAREVTVVLGYEEIVAVALAGVLGVPGEVAFKAAGKTYVDHQRKMGHSWNDPTRDGWRGRQRTVDWTFEKLQGLGLGLSEKAWVCRCYCPICGTFRVVVTEKDAIGLLTDAARNRWATPVGVTSWAIAFGAASLEYGVRQLKERFETPTLPDDSQAWEAVDHAGREAAKRTQPWATPMRVPPVPKPWRYTPEQHGPRNDDGPIYVEDLGVHSASADVLVEAEEKLAAMDAAGWKPPVRPEPAWPAGAPPEDPTSIEGQTAILFELAKYTYSFWGDGCVYMPSWNGCYAQHGHRHFSEDTVIAALVAWMGEDKTREFFIRTEPSPIGRIEFVRWEVGLWKEARAHFTGTPNNRQRVLYGTDEEEKSLVEDARAWFCAEEQESARQLGAGYEPQTAARCALEMLKKHGWRARVSWLEEWESPRSESNLLNTTHGAMFLDAVRRAIASYDVVGVRLGWCYASGKKAAVPEGYLFQPLRPMPGDKPKQEIVRGHLAYPLNDACVNCGIRRENWDKFPPCTC